MSLLLWVVLVLVLLSLVGGFALNHWLFVLLVVALVVYLFDRGRGVGPGSTTL